MIDLGLIAAVALVGAIAAVSLYKIRRMHIMLYQVRDRLDQLHQGPFIDLFQQLQLLDTLNHELQLRAPLPPLRGWAASPDFLLSIAREARARGPDVLVECSSGASTVVLARCTELNGRGHVYSLEHDPEYASRTRSELHRQGLSRFATVLDAPLIEYQLRDRSWRWYDVEALPQSDIDMLVIDGPPFTLGPLSRYPAGPILFPKLSAEPVVYLDDAARPGEKQIVSWWEDEFPELLVTEQPLEKGCARISRSDRSSAVARSPLAPGTS